MVNANCAESFHDLHWVFDGQIIGYIHEFEFIIVENYRTFLKFSDVTGGESILGCEPTTSLSIDVYHTGVYISYSQYLQERNLSSQVQITDQLGVAISDFGDDSFYLDQEIWRMKVTVSEAGIS